MTAGPSPPPGELFFSCYTPRRCTLIGNPINCGKAVWRVVIPTSSSNTGCKMSAVNAFDPWCCGLVHQERIRVIHVVNGKLYVNFFVRVKYVWFKLDDITLILCPRRKVRELMSSFLKRKTCKWTKTINTDYFFILLWVCFDIPDILYLESRNTNRTWSPVTLSVTKVNPALSSL